MTTPRHPSSNAHGVHRGVAHLRARRVGRIAALLATAAIAAACSSSGNSTASTPYNGVVRDTPLVVADQSLTDVTDAANLASGVVEDGKLRMRATDDRILLVYFGFTNCPDVCPTTLADLRVALKNIPEDVRDRVDIAFATVDPERDTAEILNRYSKHFFERFHVLRGTEEDVKQVTKSFLASFTIDKSTGRTEVSHTAVLYAVDATGAVRIEWPFGTSGQKIGEDLVVLSQELYGVSAS